MKMTLIECDSCFKKVDNKKVIIICYDCVIKERKKSVKTDLLI